MQLQYLFLGLTVSHNCIRHHFFLDSALFFSPICSASHHLSSLSSHRVKQAKQIDYKQWAGGIEGERQSKFVVDKE